MANMNLNSFTKSADEHNITGYQLIMGKAKSNVIGMLYGGYNFDRLSLWTRADIDNLMDCIKHYGAKVAYEMHESSKTSVAKQKINTARGRSHEECIQHREQQQMTYADTYKHLIQFKNNSLGACLECLKDLTENNESIMGDNMNNYEVWIEHVKAGFIEDAKGNTTRGLARAKEFIINALSNNDIYIINECIYTNYNLVNFVKVWTKANGGRIGDAEAQKLVNKWVADMQGV